ncbi:MAG: L-serine ammonia-lyase, iron-sulfur-dependent subunit beta [Clostridia bacterium]|nr:L-serine ammonia-lyase, iron-sulfur-dependent subunit beta [Clostridia bacterium]
MSSIFHVIGPIMIGPSSSHTAGAVRLGLAGRAIAGARPTHAVLTLHGSFAQTYRGHGTDVALVAGLLGLGPDDERIPNAFHLASEYGLEVRFEFADLGDVHPNTAKMELTAPDGSVTSIIGSSVGGGSIVITRINQFDVEYHGEYNALIASYTDQPGIIAKITSLLAAENVNIATMRVSREARNSRAMAVVELDQPISPEARMLITRIQGVDGVMSLPPVALA